MTASLFLCVLTAPVWFATGYLGLLTLLSGRLRAPPAGEHRPRFAIVVPAHDEADGIGRTVDSLRALDWPTDRRRIVVVADNCTDRTAEIARGAGAEVIERHDPQRRGKGFALRLAFDRLAADRWADAMVVVDADSDVTINLLQAFAARLACGAQAVQAFHGVRNPHASRRTALMTIAFTLFHRVRGRGRERLGLSAGLRGNGMCFTLAALDRVPYAAYSRVEDLEYGAELARGGIRVWYADEAEVLSDMVSTDATARSQRARWEGGRAAFARRQAGPLLAVALRRRDAVMLDLAIDVMLPPLGVIVVAAGLTAALAIACHALGWIGAGLTAGTLLPGLLLAAHVTRGVVLSGLGARGWSALATAPAAVMRKLLERRRISSPSSEWVRTQRERKERDP